MRGFYFDKCVDSVKKKMNDEIIAMCTLGRIFGFKPLYAHAMVNELGSASAVFGLSAGQKAELLGAASKYVTELNDEALEHSREELERLQKEGCSFISFLDDDYPALLKECDDPPVGIYYKGTSPAKDTFSRPMVSIVGTRDISLYGTEWCRRIISWIAEAKNPPTIVSGMALGVDIVSHRAALEAHIPTIGVMPTGIDDVYPARHRPDASRMVQAEGSALITDYPPCTSPIAINFIRRNRIIAGISPATILIESKVKGGGMITARLASSYGRDLYVLPGRIDDARSAGCNALLREKLAEPITDEASFLEAIGCPRPSRRKESDLMEEIGAKLSGALDSENLQSAKRIAKAIKDERGISMEEIAQKLALPYQDTAMLVRLLESEGFIETDVLQRCSIMVKIV